MTRPSKHPFGQACLTCRQRPAIRTDGLCAGCGELTDSDRAVLEDDGRLVGDGLELGRGRLGINTAAVLRRVDAWATAHRRSLRNEGAR